MTKVRIGIVGSGGAAKHGTERFSRIDTVDIIAIASRNCQTGTQLAQKYEAAFIPDWRDLVQRENLDGIVIFTHNDSHGEIAIAALQADKHVLTEYPLARSIAQGEAAIKLAKSKGRVLRASHSEPVSNSHQAIKQKVQELGGLLLAAFWRLTPGRGARPEILFNLPVSGPPAHFFIHHIYPVVDLFGPAVWVDGASVYEGLTDDGKYDRFVNTVTVGFKGGGIGQWTWAGGIETKSPEQHYRYVSAGGTIVNSGGGWSCATSSGFKDIQSLDLPSISIQELWIQEILQGETSAADADTAKAFEAIRISLSAEQSMQKQQRLMLT